MRQILFQGIHHIMLTALALVLVVVLILMAVFYHLWRQKHLVTHAKVKRA